MPQSTRDVLVVGGGIIGCSIAWRLAQCGLKVTLAERTRIGAEASTAGAGMLAPGGELSEDTFFSRLMVRSAKLYPEFVRELSQVTGEEIEFSRCGAVENASSEAHWRALRSRIALQRAMGIRVEELANALSYPDDGYVYPAHVMRALEAACERAGVEMARTCVPELVVNAGVVRAVDSQSSCAVVAAGAWSGSVKLSGAPPLPATKPVRGHLIAYKLAAGAIQGIYRKGHTYVFQRRDGTVIAGATTEEAGFVSSIDPKAVESIDARAQELLPVLRGCRPQTAWTGFRPAMVKGEPAIGRHYDAPLWLAYGHYRNGILGAPATAELIAKQITSILGKH